MWHLDEALTLVRGLHGEFMAANWSVGIAGGVLYRGWSDHDLDLIMVPWNSCEPDYAAIDRILVDRGWKKVRTVAQMHAHWRNKNLPDCKRVEEWSVKGKRVDVVVPLVGAG